MRKTTALVGCLVLTLTSLPSAFAQDGGGGPRRFQRGEGQQDENSGGGQGGGRRRFGGGEEGGNGQGGPGQGGGFGRGNRFGGDQGGGGPGGGRWGQGGDQTNAMGGQGGFNRGPGSEQPGNAGFGRGGGPGGGFGMGGGPGGMGGGPGGMNSADFIRRLDANGNGIIDPSEMDNRTRFMIERAGLDPSAPVSVDKLATAMERMRSERGGGEGGGPGGGGKGNRRDGEPRQGNDSSNDKSEKKNGKSSANEKPLVPGFGEQVSLQTVPSFGEPAPAAATESKSSSKYVPKQVRNRTPAQLLPDGLPDWFLRDSEGEGQVLMHQFHGPSYLTTWNDARVAEFAKYDLNGDGVLTAEEVLKVAGKR